jgi:hypothetical protein
MELLLPDYHQFITHYCFITESRGTGGLLMKVGSKRRRSKQEIEDDKVEKLVRQQAIEDKLANMKKLQEELQATQHQVASNQAASDAL